jgi:hypothetical protein
MAARFAVARKAPQQWMAQPRMERKGAGGAYRMNQPKRATYLLGAGAALRQEIGAPVPRAQQSRLEDVATQIRVALDPGSFALAWTAGAALTWEQAGDFVAQLAEATCEPQPAAREEAM